MNCIRCGRRVEPGVEGARCAGCGAERASATNAETSPGSAATEEGKASRAPAGRYRSLEPIGQGGMGAVWKAWDAELGRPVALKRLHPADEANPSLRARFLREAQLAARLRHPGIVAVYDVGEEDGRPFLAMELIAGRSFDRMLAEASVSSLGGSRTPTTALRESVEVLAAVAEAIAYAHGEGVVHRDLKPANVLIASGSGPIGGFVRVTDFGLAKEAGAGGALDPTRITASGQALGTPDYMSPEQARGEAAAVGPATDVWSLGAMLYEVLAGSAPFAREGVFETMRAVVNEEPPPPRSLRPDVPADLERLCLAALVKDPAARGPGAHEFAAELRRWLGGEPLRTRTPGAIARGLRRLAPHRAVVAVLVLAVALAATAAGWAAWRRDRAAVRREEMRADVAALLRTLEQQLLMQELSEEDRTALAAQPLGIVQAWSREDPADGLPYALRGHILELLDRPEEASADYDRACGLAPQTAFVWHRRGMFRVRTYAARHAAFSQTSVAGRVEIVQTTKETADAVRLRDDGLADLERSLRAEPGAATVSAEDARLGKAAAAMASFTTAALEGALRLSDGIDSPAGILIRANALFQLQRMDEARDALTAALRRWPAFLDARALRALVGAALGEERLVRGGDAREAARTALEDLETLARRRPEDGLNARWSARVRLTLADALIRSGEDPGAEYARVRDDGVARVTADPRDAEAWDSLGAVHRRIAEWRFALGHDSTAGLEEAMRCHDRAVDLRPDWTAPRMSRALLCQRLGALARRKGDDPEVWYTRAEADLEEVLRRAPAAPMVRMALATLHARWAADLLQRGQDPSARVERALAELEHATRADPGLPEVHANRAGVLEQRGRWEEMSGRDPRPSIREAIEALDEALRLNPDLGMARLNRGTYRAWQARTERSRGGDPSAAFEAAEADLRAARASGQVRASYYLGRLFEEAGRIDDAVREYETTVQTVPDWAAAARQKIAELRARADQARDWKGQLAAAGVLLDRGENAQALTAYQAGLRAFADEWQLLPEVKREGRLAQPEVREVLAATYYNLACVLVRLAQGRGGPGLAAREVPVADRARMVDDAFTALEAAVRFGFRDAGHAEQDEDLALLRGDGRWGRVKAAMGGK